MPQEKNPLAMRPAQARWSFDPDIPTHDFLEEGSLDDDWNLQEAIENFVYWLEEDRLLTWEAVVCDEQELPLTSKQKDTLDGRVLSLPLGVKSAEQVVHAELRHKLWLQYCFVDLGGLGQEGSVTLEDPEEHDRIEWFIGHLRECKESVAYFNLNLESLLNKVILPAKDRPIFLATMQDRLGLSSVQEPLCPNAFQGGSSRRRKEAWNPKRRRSGLQHRG